ncbi:MAG: hypothetical protein WCR04_07490, partial [Fibrobacteraceae bacterium]
SFVCFAKPIIGLGKLLFLSLLPLAMYWGSLFILQKQYYIFDEDDSLSLKIHLKWLRCVALLNFVLLLKESSKASYCSSLHLKRAKRGHAGCGVPSLSVGIARE